MQKFLSLPSNMHLKKLFPPGRSRSRANRRSTHSPNSPRRQHVCQGRESRTPRYSHPLVDKGRGDSMSVIVAPVRTQSLMRGCYQVKEEYDDVPFQLELHFITDAAAAATSSHASVTTKMTDCSGISRQRPVFTTLAALFQEAVIDNDASKINGRVQDIALQPLIEACWAFEHQMRRTKNVLAAKDFSLNTLKVQRVLDDAPLSVQTISGLLAYEKSTGCHRAIGPKHQQVKLRDPSAAIGLLWIRRNLMFQYQIYLNTFVHAMHPQEAALAAYRQELDPHLGNSWTLRKIFQLGCKVAVPGCSRAFLAKLNDYDPRAFSKEQQVLAMQGIEAFLATLQPVLARWEQIFRELGLEE